MSDTHETMAMRETLQFLIGSDMPAQHKSILIEAVTQALKTQQAEENRVAALKNVIQEWEPPETKIVADFLDKKLARSWQHADEIVMRLAGELHRDPGDVRQKAIELGFGGGVDYRLAKAQAISRSG